MLRRLWLIFTQAVTIASAVGWAYVLTTSSPHEAPVEGPRGDYSDAVGRAAPAVVNIFTRTTTPGDGAEETGSDWNASPERELHPLGSGVIVSKDGHVLTNYHVVEEAPNLHVALPDGRTFEATLAGGDAETDLATLVIKGEDLPVIELGESRELKIGQVVLAIGNPFDVGQTVTMGIVSALGRHGLGLNNYEDFIQTDAAINQGNSGGALIDLEGRLIGINTAIFSPEHSEGFVGIGFAIPTSIIRQVLPAMLKGEDVRRGYLGFIPRQFTEELSRDLGLGVPAGVMVRRVLPGTPADTAGLRHFDVILEMNGVRTERVNRLLQQIAATPPGTVVKLKVLRSGRTMEISLRAAKREAGSLERESDAP